MIPFNFITLKEYSGSNLGLQAQGEYNCFATFLQIKNSGYSVKKGAKGYRVSQGFKEVTKEDEDGTIKSFQVPKYCTVFELQDTSAIDDKNLIKEFIHVQPSDQQINDMLTAGMFGGDKAVEEVFNDYESYRQQVAQV